MNTFIENAKKEFREKFEGANKASMESSWSSIELKPIEDFLESKLNELSDLKDKEYEEMCGF